MSNGEKEIWVLGSTNHAVDKCITWYEAMPSFVDFDILIIDFNNLDKYFFENKLDKIDDSFIEIEKRIANDGILVCLLSKNYHEMILTYRPTTLGSGGYPHDRYEETRNMYYLLPVVPTLTKQTPSKTLKFATEVFARDYYKNVEKVSHVLTGFAYGGRYGGRVSLDKQKQYVLQDTIVKTKGGDLVGCSFMHYNGIIHFLPPPTKISPSDAIDILIGEVKKQYFKDTSILKRPKWIDKYVYDDEKKIIDNLSKLEVRYVKEKEKLKKEQKSYTEIDKIVWLCGEIGQGKPLENAVKNFLEKEFAFKIEKTKPGSHADLKGTYAGMKFAFEITGVKGAVSKQIKKVGQTMNYHLEKEENEKIVLIANTYCTKEISNRSKAEKDNFTDYVVNPLKSLNVCLLTTLQLFNLWKDMKEDKITKKKIIDKIYNTDGVLS